MLRDAEDVHDPRLELDDEADIELGEVDRLDGEEVRRQDSLGLRGEGLLPAPFTSRRWSSTEARTTPQIADAKKWTSSVCDSPWMRIRPQAPVLAIKASHALDSLI
jgi:hypothetical protein